MSTGGVATLISIQPHPFPGMLSIGAFFYVLNLIMFATLCTLMITRFAKFPGSFKESIKHEREGLFLGPFFLSVATIITSTQKYVVQAYDINHPTRGWMVTSISIAFWLYTFLTFCLAVFQYSFLFVGHTYMLTKFMPSWLLPIFPIMLAGTIASTIAADQPIESRMPILVAGLGCQGLGFTVAILMYAHYIGRLMQVGLPNREHRPAMFIGVGPPSFTCLALIGMANALPKDFDLQGDGLLDGNLLRTMALVVALFLWVLAMWFFMIALVAVSFRCPSKISLQHANRFPRLFTHDPSTSISDGGPWSFLILDSSLLRSLSAKNSRTRPFSSSATDSQSLSSLCGCLYSSAISGLSGSSTLCTLDATRMSKIRRTTELYRATITQSMSLLAISATRHAHGSPINILNTSKHRYQLTASSLQFLFCSGHSLLHLVPVNFLFFLYLSLYRAASLNAHGVFLKAVDIEVDSTSSCGVL
jgi:tellurite resistance protein TehA-like permease